MFARLHFYAVPFLLTCIQACTERTPKTHSRGDLDIVPPDISLAPLDPPPPLDASIPRAVASSAPPIASSLHDAAPPKPFPFKYGFCGAGRMWIYPNAACGAAAKPVCVPVPPPMLDVHCGCDGVSYSLASAPWVFAGYCRGDASAPGL